jgi:phosphoglycolate phosphatase-like HAD superfamily hydrolase
MNVVPLRTPTGRFQVVSDDGNFVVAKKNADRYATYMYVADRIDPKTAAAWYKRNYPLFQQAYRDLGTNGYFNDRLVEVIDHLLAAPEPKGNQQLIPAKEGYVYANQALEQLSVGQKFMIRVGPANEAKLKAKLQALREAIVSNAPAQASNDEAPSDGR